MNKEEKKGFKNAVEKLQIKKILKTAKDKGLIKPHTEAFEENPVQNEVHKGNINYFIK